MTSSSDSQEAWLASYRSQLNDIASTYRSTARSIISQSDDHVLESLYVARDTAQRAVSKSPDDFSTPRSVLGDVYWEAQKLPLSMDLSIEDGPDAADQRDALWRSFVEMSDDIAAYCYQGTSVYHELSESEREDWHNNPCNRMSRDDQHSNSDTENGEYTQSTEAGRSSDADIQPRSGVADQSQSHQSNMTPDTNDKFKNPTDHKEIDSLTVSSPGNHESESESSISEIPSESTYPSPSEKSDAAFSSQ